MDWIGGLINGVFSTATGITTAIVNGKTQRVSIQADADKYIAEVEADTNKYSTQKTQGGKTSRTVIIGVVVLAAIVLFGIFVWRK